MRTKKKKTLYVVFLLITLLMFLHSWKSYMTPADEAADYVKKHQHHHHHVPHLLKQQNDQDPAIA